MSSIVQINLFFNILDATYIFIILLKEETPLSAELTVS